MTKRNLFSEVTEGFQALADERTCKELPHPQTANEDQYVPFVLSDYISNPIRVARLEADLTQAELAKRLAVTQGYISKIEGYNFKVTPTLLTRVIQAIRHSA